MPRVEVKRLDCVLIKCAVTLHSLFSLYGTCPCILLHFPLCLGPPSPNVCSYTCVHNTSQAHSSFKFFLIWVVLDESTFHIFCVKRWAFNYDIRLSLSFLHGEKPDLTVIVTDNFWAPCLSLVSQQPKRIVARLNQVSVQGFITNRLSFLTHVLPAFSAVAHCFVLCCILRKSYNFVKKREGGDELITVIINIFVMSCKINKSALACAPLWPCNGGAFARWMISFRVHLLKLLKRENIKAFCFFGSKFREHVL